MSDTVEHLSAAQIAAFVDGSFDTGRPPGVETHLAQCARCRDEVVESTRLVSSVLRPGWHHATAWGIAIGSAAVLVLSLFPLSRNRDEPQRHRKAPVASVIAPRSVAPAGVIDSLRSFVWSAVPGADRYELRVFSADGAIVWGRETTDTTAIPPDSLRLRNAQSYYWKVEAQVGFGRRTASNLREFSLGKPR